MNQRAQTQELLRLGEYDWVSLDDVLWVATRDARTQEAKTGALRLLERVYRDELLVPGDLGESGFEDWPGGADGWLNESRTELERLGWRPMGAGFWLRLTPLGRAQLAEGRRP